MYNPPLVSNAMVEKIVTVGNTEVQIEETEDGFEVTEVFDPDPGTVEHFAEHVISEGDATSSVGSVSEIESAGTNSVRLYVNDEAYDVVGNHVFEVAADAGYEPTAVEFEYGYIAFEYQDESEDTELL
jgi:hypothetical protein